MNEVRPFDLEGFVNSVRYMLACHDPSRSVSIIEFRSDWVPGVQHRASGIVEVRIPRTYVTCGSGDRGSTWIARIAGTFSLRLRLRGIAPVCGHVVAEFELNTRRGSDSARLDAIIRAAAHDAVLLVAIGDPVHPLLDHQFIGPAPVDQLDAVCEAVQTAMND